MSIFDKSSPNCFLLLILIKAESTKFIKDSKFLDSKNLYPNEISFSGKKGIKFLINSY